MTGPGPRPPRPPKPPTPPEPDPMTGPYDPANGSDAQGHPVNGSGRCELLNTTGSCP